MFGSMKDEIYLRESVRPDYREPPDPVVVVDLFSGCGGLTLGLAEAARAVGRGLDVALAVDFDPEAAAVFRANFPGALVEPRGVQEIFDGDLGTSLTSVERKWRSELGRIDVLQGGPPCQGHSDLNNHTRRDDPRNVFYERIGRAAEVLEPQVVLIENVPPVRNDKGRVVDRVLEILEGCGYVTGDRVIDFHRLGVPQRRKRHTILALQGSLELDPSLILHALASGPRLGEGRDLSWAIGDLQDIVDPASLDVPSRMSSDNAKRAGWLIRKAEVDLPNSLRPPCHQGDHSYGSMYGRLSWDKPAQTITSGYGSMGQGRYLHPSQKRTITPHEAARIQFFPDWFDFTASGAVSKRGAWATMIGNAVPPKLTMELGRVLLPHLTV